MNTIKKSIMTAAVWLLLSAVAVGCNTVKGAGRDIERGGEKIQGGAEGARDN
jgi:predicted small secreted protein